MLVQSMPTVADTQWMLAVADATPWCAAVGWWTSGRRTRPRRSSSWPATPSSRACAPCRRTCPTTTGLPTRDRPAEAMACHGLVFDALVLPRQLPGLLRFARRHPQLRLVIDHAAKPHIARGEIEPWRADMAQLARCRRCTASSRAS